VEGVAGEIADCKALQRDLDLRPPVSAIAEHANAFVADPFAPDPVTQIYVICI
jgi:hypothetical protein